MNPGIGLALSGGAARGVAHLGVLQALEDNNIRPACIAGTSVGALIASFYAFDVTLKEMREIAEQASWMDFSNFRLSKMGILSNKHMGKLIEKTIGDRNIEDAEIPLGVVATDIMTGERAVFRSGSVAEAVMASAAIPGIYAPVKVGEKNLVDGMLSENVPVTPLREMGADLIVAVNLGSKRDYKEPDDLFDVIMNALNITVNHITQQYLRIADVVIQPDVSQFSYTNTKKSGELFSEGYRAAALSIKEIESGLDKVQRQKKPNFFGKLRTIFR